LCNELTCKWRCFKRQKVPRYKNAKSRVNLAKKTIYIAISMSISISDVHKLMLMSLCKLIYILHNDWYTFSLEFPYAHTSITFLSRILNLTNHLQFAHIVLKPYKLYQITQTIIKMTLDKTTSYDTTTNKLSSFIYINILMTSSAKGNADFNFCLHVFVQDSIVGKTDMAW